MVTRYEVIYEHLLDEALDRALEVMAEWDEAVSATKMQPMLRAALKKRLENTPV